MRPYWHLAGLSVLVGLVVIGLGLLAPWPMKILIDSVLGTQPPPKILTSLLGGVTQKPVLFVIVIVLAEFGLNLLRNALSVVDSYATTKMDLGMTLDFKSDLFQHAQRLSLSYHDQNRSGMLLYVVNTVGSAPTHLLLTLLPLGQSVVTLIGMFWITYRLDPQLALLSLTVVPVLYYSTGYYATHIQARLHDVRTMEGDAMSLIHESLTMLRVIVAFGREDHEYKRVRTQGERANAARVKLTLRQTAFSLGVNLTTAAGTALVLGVGAYHVLQRQLTVGELLIVMSYIASVYNPLKSISTTIGEIQVQVSQLDLAFALQDTEPDVKDRSGAITLETVKGEVSFEDVHFNYASRTDTLKGLSFEAKPGQAIAIVGPTGAGKTTLMSLIPRFYDVTRGSVRVDGVDVQDLSLRSLRSHVSIVMQEPLLFSASIAENIRYGRLNATMDEIVEAAKAANAHNFIMDLPQQYDTELGERGAKLSGGERQRISLARAFLKNAPILILDEPTSSVDSHTESVILDALDRLMVGRTTFIVAHRLGTLRHANLILVMDHGQIVERGTHAELLELGGLYRKLYDLQTGMTRRRIQEIVRRQTIATETTLQ